MDYNNYNNYNFSYPWTSTSHFIPSQTNGHHQQHHVPANQPQATPTAAVTPAQGQAQHGLQQPQPPFIINPV